MKIIYHAACKDGWCSAWVAHRRYPDAELVEGHFGHAPPDVKGHDVLIVDFCYPRPVMEQILRDANSLTVLDHHKTAQEAMKGFANDNYNTQCRIVFDMERSGAGLTWDTLFPGEPRPWLVWYVEDKDLWRHKLPDSALVNAYLSTLEFSIEVWDRELAKGDIQYAAELGRAIQAKTYQYVREVSKNARRITFEGHDVPIVNAPQIDISELLAWLCKEEKFAMGWFQRADGQFKYSMRSTGFDVSELAARYGGGGHKTAAGFQLDRMLSL